MSTSSDDASQSQVGLLAAASRGLLAAAQVERLILLDEIWSDQIGVLRDDPSSGRPDFEGLIELADEIDRALGETDQAASQLWGVLEQFDDALDQRLLELASSSDNPVPLQDLLGDDWGDRPIRFAFIAACSYVREQSGAERERIASKREELQQGVIPEPSVSDMFLCAASLVAIGGPMALASAGAVPVIGVVASAAIGSTSAAALVGTTWKKSGCKAAWRTVRQHFAG